MSHVVILFKSPSQDSNNDPYVLALHNAGYKTYFVPVLETNFVNQNALANIVLAGPNMSCNGVVITSSRAAEAWIHALDRANDLGDWSEVPFYVVGDATARPLRKMATSYPTKFSESLILGAKQGGKAESLAQFVLDDLSSRQQGSKLLYLTGDKNRDTFLRIMTEHNIHVQSMMVYETTAALNLSARVAEVAQDINLTENRKASWLVFFAPSSAGSVIPHLRNFFCLPSLIEPLDDLSLLPAKLGAIGPTTSEYLRMDQKLRVDAVTPEPTASQLAAALCAADTGTMVAGKTE